MNMQDRIDANRARDAEVLRRRAAQLARPASSPASANAGVHVLEFSVGEQRCLIEIDWLREARMLRDLLPVPLAPEPLLGLVQLRGLLLPVLDVAGLLGVAAGQRGRATRLLVVGRDAPALGVAASEVHGLQRLSREEAERRSEPLESMRPEIVRGITPDGHLLLDGERLLAMHRSARS